MDEDQILSNILKGYSKSQVRVIYTFITNLALNGVNATPFAIQLMLTNEMSETDKTFLNKKLKEISAL